MCVSAAKTYVPRSYIKYDDCVIILGKSMKLLGFHFDNRPTVDAHVNTILKKSLVPDVVHTQPEETGSLSGGPSECVCVISEAVF